MMGEVSQILKRGALIVLEGCDKAGKTTQSLLLKNALIDKKFDAKLMRFPDRSSKIGRILDNYLSESTNLEDHAIHLLFSANRWECVHDIKKMLDSGTTIIIDRYAFSGVAFSSAKGLDLSWCKQCDVGLPKPDLVLFLDLKGEDAKKRKDFGCERYEKEAFQANVYERYMQLKDDSWKIIDASRNVEEIHTELVHHTFAVVEKEKDTSVKGLWESINC